MVGVTEGFASYVLDEGNTEEYYTYQMRFMLIVLVVKLLFIFLVSQFLWPRVMPKISSSIKSNPGFLNILGLSMIFSLLV